MNNKVQALAESALCESDRAELARRRVQAAAPELADALRDILTEVDGGWFHESPVAKRARAALAKAEGRQEP